MTSPHTKRSLSVPISARTYPQYLGKKTLPSKKKMQEGLKSKSCAVRSNNLIPPEIPTSKGLQQVLCCISHPHADAPESRLPGCRAAPAVGFSQHRPGQPRLSWIPSSLGSKGSFSPAPALSSWDASRGMFSLKEHLAISMAWGLHHGQAIGKWEGNGVPFSIPHQQHRSSKSMFRRAHRCAETPFNR